MIMMRYVYNSDQWQGRRYQDHQFSGKHFSAFVCCLCKSGLVLSAVYSSNVPATENQVGYNSVIIHQL